MKVQYVVIYERDEEDYWGYVPDLPGCFSAGDDLEDMNRMMREGIAAHIEVLMGYGDPVPPARSSVADAMVEHARLLSEPLGEELEARMAAEGIDPPTDAAETIFSVLEVDVEHELAELEKYWTLLAGSTADIEGAQDRGAPQGFRCAPSGRARKGRIRHLSASAGHRHHGDGFGIRPSGVPRSIEPRDFGCVVDVSALYSVPRPGRGPSSSSGRSKASRTPTSSLSRALPSVET